MRVDPQPLAGDLEFAALESEPFERDAGEPAETYSGTIKWFDVTRGFGFLVADDPEIGDILIHFTVLQEHGRRSLPEGTRVECQAVRRQRGLQARSISAIDLSGASRAGQDLVGSILCDDIEVLYDDDHVRPGGGLPPHVMRRVDAALKVALALT